MGPPGAGKGTQAEFIVNGFQIPHISTGDAFRLAMNQGTPLGKKAKEYVDQGLLVPDDITIGIVNDRLQLDDCKEGFLLDGFPRTVSQAEALDHILSSQGRNIHHVIYLVVDRNRLLDRLTGRRVCQSCGATFHIQIHPSAKSGVCDKCGGTIIQRSDDTAEKVGTRLDEYANKTAPVLDYYNRQGLLKQINGEQEIGAVTHELESLLRGQA